MIYDKLENIGLYQGCHPNLDLAIRFILEHDLASLPPGKTEIAGDQVYVNVQDTTARPFERENTRSIRSTWIFRSTLPGWR